MYRINNTGHAICVLIVWLIAATGCTSAFSPRIPAENTPVVKGEHFVLVTATAQDSLASLATRYLDDANKAWWIADYNQIETVTPGQQVVVPLIPLSIGGLRTDSYQTVPVLRYTHLAFRPTKQSSVSTQDFERQMIYLKENDFVTISLEQFNRFLNLHDQLPPNAVVITFDTAGRWVYDIALPILRRHGMKATLFVPAEQIGHPGKLAWYQLARMAADGFDIGAHGPKINSFNGKNLSSTTGSLDNYILQSKKAIERHLNRPCRDYSAPSNAVSDLATAILKKHGFRTCFTEKRGQNPFFVHNFKIRRSVISGQNNLHQFGQNLITFHKVQRP